jgi:hypothetical protein
VFFLSCKANASVKLAKTGHGPHSSTLVVICVVLLLFVLFYVLFVCKCVLPPGDKEFQLINISYHLSYHIISYHTIPHYLHLQDRGVYPRTLKSRTRFEVTLEKTGILSNTAERTYCERTNRKNVTQHCCAYKKLAILVTKDQID